VVVIEGAGSPAEPNLMRRDLANVRVARLAGTGSSSPGRPDVTCWTGRGAPTAAGTPAPPDHRALREAAYDRVADALADALDERLLGDLGVS
jgi:hypothetical protein